MKLHIQIKFRIFGTDLYNFNEMFDLSSALGQFGFFAQAAATAAGAIVLHSESHETIYNGHGVLIELLPA